MSVLHVACRKSRAPLRYEPGARETGFNPSDFGGRVPIRPVMRPGATDTVNTREDAGPWIFTISPKKCFAVLGTGRQLAPFSKVYPDFNLEDAYKVTAAVRAGEGSTGRASVGRKIGFTNRTIWAEYGVYAPIWGYVYDRTVFDLTGDPLEVSLSGLAEPRIEPEIVFGLAAAPEPGMDEAALMHCIDWIAHGFEIVQSIFPDWTFQAPDTVAAYGLHGRLFIGTASSGGAATRRMGARAFAL